MITYFLLCGYTPFDRDTNIEEMQAIMKADYSFTPLEYWRNVSLSARRFIQQCLTTDPNARMTSHQALTHPWITGEDEENKPKADLLPTVKKNFNARRTLHAAIDTIRAINQLRAGGAAAMGRPVQAGSDAVDATKDMANESAEQMEGVIHENMPTQESVKEGVGQLRDMDPRGNARGQTEEQIRMQEQRILHTATSLWQGKR